MRNSTTTDLVNHWITIDLDAQTPGSLTVAEAMARDMPLGLFKEYEVPAEVIEAANRSR